MLFMGQVFNGQKEREGLELWGRRRLCICGWELWKLLSYRACPLSIVVPGKISLLTLSLVQVWALNDRYQDSSSSSHQHNDLLSSLKGGRALNTAVSVGVWGLKSFCLSCASRQTSQPTIVPQSFLFALPPVSCELSRPLQSRNKQTKWLLPHCGS